MKRKWIPVILIALVILLRFLEVYLYGTPPMAIGKPIFLTEKPQEVDWEDREIYRDGLIEDAQYILDKLPEASVYRIFLNIPEEMEKGIRGHQVVGYTNAEEDNLDEIVLRLFPNFSGENMEVSDIKIGGKPVDFTLESENTTLRINLIRSLKPGESIVLEMDFDLSVTSERKSPYDLYGYADDVLLLDLFYPLIPAYDDDGWYSEYPALNGDLPYQDASFYLVEVQAPDDLEFATSGIMVDRSHYRDRNAYLFAAGPSRDFFLAGSKQFTRFEEWGGEELDITVLTHKEVADQQKFALAVAFETFDIIGEVVGEYPYTEFEIISSPMQWGMGMEYSGMTSLDRVLFISGGASPGTSNQDLLEQVLVHEIIHQWFYNTVGSDQQSEPWVDEALTEYLTYIYFQEIFLGYADEFTIQGWEDTWGWAGRKETPIGKHAGEYGEMSYAGIIYGRGPLFFLHLEEELGQAVLLKGIRDYYLDNQWETGTGEELRAALEEACACDLTKEFEEWVYGD